MTNSPAAPVSIAIRISIMLIVALLGVLPAFAEEPQVIIKGGRDASGQNYEWTITNNYSSPIVVIEIPHYHADTFSPPKGWAPETTNLQRLNARDEPGICKATAPPSGGLHTGETATVSIRIAQIGTLRGTGTVTIRFLDGRTIGVSGVDLPCAPTFFNQYGYPLGLALLLGGALLWQALRKRKKSESDEPPNDTGMPAA